MNNTKPITSHECGNGKYARRVWGSVEDCRLCTERKERMEKARAMYAKKDVIAYTDGTYARVDNFGILRDVDADFANTIIAKDERPSQPYAQPGSYPTFGEIAVVALIAVMFAVLGVWT